jgi:hypothetical protein
VSFQLNLIHILTERLAVPEYATKLDTGLGPTFAAAHRLGVQAEVTQLQTILRDPTIEFVGEAEPDRGRASFIYRSSEGYTIKHVLTTRPGGVTGGEVLIRERGSKTDITLETFVARRRPAAVPA